MTLFGVKMCRRFHRPALFLFSASTLFAGERTSDPVDGEHVFRPRAIVVGRYVTPNGTIASDAAVVMANGRIEAVVSSADFTENKEVARFPGAVLSPGLIDVRSTVGAAANVEESAEAVDPAASALDSLDPYHRDFRAAVAAGITTVLISPAPNNLVSGVGVVVKTAGTTRGRCGRVIREDGPLMLALGPSVWQYDRAPTSRLGSLAMLRHALNEAKEQRGHQRFQELVRAKRDAMVVCGEAMDVSAALRTFHDVGATFSVVYSGDEQQLAEEVAALRTPMVLGPYGFTSSLRSLSLAGKLAGADIPVVLAGGTPTTSAEGLRVTAALTVRYGLDPRLARLAITSNAARLVGVADRIGTIETGRDADLVVFSDDPLRPDAKVLVVYVDGVRVVSRSDIQHEGNEQ